MLIAEGPEWVVVLDEPLKKRLETQSANNRSRWYLGVDAEEELLWSTTHGQLATLLRMDSIQPHLHRLCGYYGELLARRLESISQIRNTLAHSRAISDESIRILRGDLDVIRAAVERFKEKTLYADQDIVSMGDDVPDDLFDFLFAFEDLQSRTAGQQLFVDASEDFLSLVRLPAPPGGWPDTAKFQRHLSEVAHLLVCLLANKTGENFRSSCPQATSAGFKNRSPHPIHVASIVVGRLDGYPVREATGDIVVLATALDITRINAPGVLNLTDAPV